MGIFMLLLVVVLLVVLLVFVAYSYIYMHLLLPTTHPQHRKFLYFKFLDGKGCNNVQSNRTFNEFSSGRRWGVRRSWWRFRCWWWPRRWWWRCKIAWKCQVLLTLIFASSHFFVLFEHCRNSFYRNLRGSSQICCVVREPKRA